MISSQHSTDRSTDRRGDSQRGPIDPPPRPAAEPRVRLRRYISISREGVYYVGVLAFILAGALTRQINLLMVLFGLMFGPLLMSWRLVKATLRRVTVTRKAPESISAGDLLVVELTVTNGRRRLGAWALELQDKVRRESQGPKAPPLPASALVTYLPPGKSVAVSYRGRLTERGQYRFGPLTLSTRFPLGLIRYRVTIDQAASLVVFPRLGQLRPAWKRLQQSPDLGHGYVARQQGFLEGEFYGLRDWRRGDSRRWVHWRTTAREQTLVVKQFEQQRNQDLAVVLDLWQPAEPQANDRDSVELAVSLAATIVADSCRGGGKWLCTGIAGESVWLESGPTSNALLHQTMHGLALADATSQDTLPEVLGMTLRRARPGTRVVVISTRQADLSDRSRFHNLWQDGAVSARLHKVVTLDVNSPDLVEYFQPL